MLDVGRMAGLTLTRIEAVDARTIERQLEFATMIDSGPVGHIGIGTLACTLSHAEAWQTFLADGAPWGVFLEDDVVLCDDFKDTVERLVQAPLPVDLVKIDTETTEPGVTPAEALDATVELLQQLDSKEVIWEVGRWGFEVDPEGPVEVKILHQALGGGFAFEELDPCAFGLDGFAGQAQEKVARHHFQFAARHAGRVDPDAVEKLVLQQVGIDGKGLVSLRIEVGKQVHLIAVFQAVELVEAQAFPVLYRAVLFYGKGVLYQVEGREDRFHQGIVGDARPESPDLVELHHRDPVVVRGLVGVRLDLPGAGKVFGRKDHQGLALAHFTVTKNQKVVAR